MQFDRKMKRRANLPCPCGSGKPYKRCHRDNDIALRELSRKAMAGELKPFAQIISENSEPSSMQFGNVSITEGGVTKVLTEGMVTLSTNTIPGDVTEKSAALIMLPPDGTTGSISTTGNATVSSGAYPLALRLNTTAKKMKATSISGGYAIAKIGRQLNTQQDYFDFLFGLKGQAEIIDPSGRKERSHIALFPDGNGKFIRLEGDGCEISTEQSYVAADNLILPRKIKIRAPQFQEMLVAEFSATDSVVELVSISFEVVTD